jgi:hypothetical protein
MRNTVFALLMLTTACAVGGQPFTPNSSHPAQAGGAITHITAPSFNVHIVFDQSCITGVNEQELENDVRNGITSDPDMPPISAITVQAGGC